MNPIKWILDWIRNQTPTSSDEPAGPPDWKGFMREILRLDTWIDSAAVKELFFGETNRIDYDPRIDAEEGPFIASNQGEHHEAAH